MKAMLLPALVALVVIPRQLPASDADAQGPVLQAESCRVELTALGQGSWRGSFRYTATADSEGYISQRNLVRPTDAMASFIRLDQFEACIARWVFSGAGQYSILFTAGTSGDALRRWSVTVSGVRPTATIPALEQLRNPPAPRRFTLVFPRE